VTVRDQPPASGNRSFTFAFRPARMCILTVEITVGFARAALAKSLIVS
jgi:hypothetical protein